MTKKIIRCPWAEHNQAMQEYHDNEWGVPSHNDNHLFEMLILETAQAGLSWQTVLNKRAEYRKAFAHFDPKVVATYGAKDIERLLKNPGIIRNKKKIEATINNAHKYLEIKKEFGSCSQFLWQSIGGKPIENHWRSVSQIPSSTPESDKLSKILKSRGMSFVGSTIIYAFMQAVGMVNDHLVTCFRHRQLISK